MFFLNVTSTGAFPLSSKLVEANHLAVPIPLLAIPAHSRRAVGRIFDTNFEQQRLAHNLSVFDTVLDTKNADRAEYFSAFRLKKELFEVFCAGRINDLALPSASECSGGCIFIRFLKRIFFSRVPPHRERHQRNDQQRFPDQPARALISSVILFARCSA
jgi:hypothetical protein